MTSRIRGYVRDPSSGAGVNPATVYVKKHSDNSTVASDATDANGLYEIAADTVGYPGEVYETVTVGSDTKVRSGRVWGQLGGLVWASDIPDALSLFGIGVANGLAVSADGSDMNVDIALGMAMLKDGCPYILEAADDLTIGTADASNPRIDRIILRLTREGQADQGKISLMVLAGTPAASPSAPALTQTSATWDFSLAQVLVGTGVTTIAANKVTDERTYCFDASGGAIDGNLDISGALSLTGSMDIGGGLTVDGAVSLGDTSSDTTTIAGHLKAFGTNPTVAVNTSVCGSTGTATINFGNDIAFEVEIVTAGTGYAAGRLCTVTFAVAFGSVNYIPVIQGLTADTALHTFYVSRASGSLQIFTNTAPVAGQTLRLGVHIIEDAT